MKKLLFFCLFLMNINIYAQDMTSNMILTNSVILMSTTAINEDDPKDHMDFYINNHRIVKNTSINMHEINNVLLRVKGIKEDFRDTNLTVKYSFNNLEDNFYKNLERDSFKNFDEKTAYVTIDKVNYQNNKATVFISVLDSVHHKKLMQAHDTGIKIVLGIFSFIAFLLFLIAICV